MVFRKKKHFTLKEIQKYIKKEDIDNIILERKNKKKKNTIKNMLGITSNDAEHEANQQQFNFNELELPIDSSEEDEEATELDADDKIYKKKPPSFDTLVEALYDASLKAQKKVQQAHIHYLDWYFKITNGYMINGNLEEKTDEEIKTEGLNEDDLTEILEPRVVKN